MSVKEISKVTEGSELKKMLYAQKEKRSGLPLLNDTEYSLLTEINKDFDDKKWIL